MYCIQVTFIKRSRAELPKRSLRAAATDAGLEETDSGRDGYEGHKHCHIVSNIYTLTTLQRDEQYNVSSSPSLLQLVSW